MTESHRLMSKYHSSLLTFSNGHLAETAHTREELKSLRTQTFSNIKQSLDKLLPQIDQLNFFNFLVNLFHILKILFFLLKRVSLNDNDLSKCLQQVLSYLEYLKFEFLRHLYLLKSFYSMQTGDFYFNKIQNSFTLI